MSDRQQRRQRIQDKRKQRGSTQTFIDDPLNTRQSKAPKPPDQKQLVAAVRTGLIQQLIIGRLMA